jgi:hypothetical protein
LLSERPHQWEHEQNCQNADKYLFWFHNAIASLIEFSIAKTRMWQRHNIQLANFDQATLRVIPSTSGPRSAWSRRDDVLMEISLGVSGNCPRGQLSRLIAATLEWPRGAVYIVRFL